MNRKRAEIFGGSGFLFENSQCHWTGNEAWHKMLRHVKDGMNVSERSM